MPPMKDLMKFTVLLLMWATHSSWAQALSTYDFYQRSLGVRNNSCSFLLDCNDCIRKPECVWCLDPTLEGPRCDLRSWFEGKGNVCNELEDPQNDVELMEKKNLTTDASNEDGFVQISPQRVKVKLRVGMESKIRFKVAQAKQYPVDLYYLMDLSNSMSDDKANIVKLGEKIASAIQNITNDFKIGFGSFVDKEVMPFISLVKDKNCQQKSCPKPYSFKHQMKLGSNVKLFQQKVEEAPISGNIDNPEGGFDGLVQVMVCEDLIGWRKESRRVIIFTTDQSFHIGLDGKLGGLVLPNDGQCHLNETTGFYTHSTILDYPSIGQINYLAEKHRVSVIWAVTADQIDLYSSMTTVVEGSTAGVISNDSSNIVQLVRNQYESITTTIKVQTNSSSNCQTKITSKCKGQGQECKNIELGTSVDYELAVTLKSCQPETISVQPVGLKGQMIVEIEPICDCPCKERTISQKDACNSEICNFNGHVVCGECICCSEDIFGPTCNCILDVNSTINPLNPHLSCRPNFASLNDPVCNGRGNCVCGQCQCVQQRKGVVISGQFCEKVCDNTACPQDKERNLCSGNGKCRCGKCICDEGWNNNGNFNDCSCRNEPEMCRSPLTPHLDCSGQGQCLCSKCKCNHRYSGEFCEICETCKTVCQELRPCVECRAFQAGDLVEGMYQTEEERQELIRNRTLECDFDYFESIPSEIPEDWENCTLTYENCRYTFSYSDYRRDFMPKIIILHLTEDEEKMDCPKPPDYFGIVAGVVGAIVCLGVLTVFLWKAFTSIHDRREFARFEAERQRISFPSHSNPIFKQATTTIQNPIFNSPHYY